MARYIAQQEFAFNKLQGERAIIPDSGTSITVEFYSGTEWIEDSNSPITSPYAIYTKGLRVRLTPDVGGFFIDEAQDI